MSSQNGDDTINSPLEPVEDMGVTEQLPQTVGKETPPPRHWTIDLIELIFGKPELLGIVIVSISLFIGFGFGYFYKDYIQLKQVYSEFHKILLDKEKTCLSKAQFK